MLVEVDNSCRAKFKGRNPNIPLDNFLWFQALVDEVIWYLCLSREKIVVELSFIRSRWFVLNAFRQSILSYLIIFLINLSEPSITTLRVYEWIEYLKIKKRSSILNLSYVLPSKLREKFVCTMLRCLYNKEDIFRLKVLRWLYLNYFQ